MAESKKKREGAIYVGTAGWSIPRQYAGEFSEEGSHLIRYAGRLNAVEINSSFYRPHRPATYVNWASSVPDDFRFSVKIPKLITHEMRLVETEVALNVFLKEVTHLSDKLGVLLVQLPPSLAFEKKIVTAFFKNFRKMHKGGIACEPRHASWFTEETEALFVKFDVARLAADPAKFDQAFVPGGAAHLVYYRLHGSPGMYRSNYDESFIKRLRAKLRAAAKGGATCWCIFDNTTLGYATGNALEML